MFPMVYTLTVFVLHALFIVNKSHPFELFIYQNPIHRLKQCLKYIPDE